MTILLDCYGSRRG